MDVRVAVKYMDVFHNPPPLSAIRIQKETEQLARFFYACKYCDGVDENPRLGSTKMSGTF